MSEETTMTAPQTDESVPKVQTVKEEIEALLAICKALENMSEQGRLASLGFLCDKYGTPAMKRAAWVRP